MKTVAALAVVCAAPAAAEPLHLVCLGAGSANKEDTSTAYASNSYGESGWAQVTGNRSVPFEDQVNIELDGATGKIRMPRTMLPPLHGGEGGWFELKNLKTTETEITASAAVNFINSPKVRLDRTTGRISIAGKAGHYSGVCEPYDPASVQRKF